MDQKIKARLIFDLDWKSVNTILLYAESDSRKVNLKRNKYDRMKVYYVSADSENYTAVFNTPMLIELDNWTANLLSSSLCKLMC